MSASIRHRNVSRCIGVTTAAAIAYGIAHDLVTARISLEYFTVGHMPLFNWPTPTRVAFAWGILATWWVGLLAGVALGLASTLGIAPPYAASRLWRLLLATFAVIAPCELVVGSAAHALYERGLASLPARVAERIPPERHAAFFAVAAAHTCGYALAALGTVVLCVLIWKRRRPEAAG